MFRNDVNVRVKEGKIRSSGYGKQRVKAMLSTAYSHEVSSYTTFSRETMPKNEIFHKDLIVQARKRMVTTDLMDDWEKNL
jgi:hypothetical protein